MKLQTLIILSFLFATGFNSSATAQKKKHTSNLAYTSMIKEWREISKTGEDASKNRSVTWTLKIVDATQGSRTGYIGGDSKYPVVIMPTKPYYDARFPSMTEEPVDWADAIMQGKVPNNVSLGSWVEFSGRYYMNVNSSQEVFFIDRINKISPPQN